MLRLDGCALLPLSLPHYDVLLFANLEFVLLILLAEFHYLGNLGLSLVLGFFEALLIIVNLISDDLKLTSQLLAKLEFTYDCVGLVWAIFGSEFLTGIG